MKRPRWYCEMCDEWFRLSGDCPKCGYQLRRELPSRVEGPQ
jgi:hypothetical protein